MARVSEQTAMRIDHGCLRASHRIRQAWSALVFGDRSPAGCSNRLPGGRPRRRCAPDPQAIRDYAPPLTAFVRTKSSRCLVADQNWILLTPQLQLCAWRAGADAGPGPVTLLLEASDFEGVAVPDRPAVVSDTERGGEVAARIGQCNVRRVWSDANPSVDPYSSVCSRGARHWAVLVPSAAGRSPQCGSTSRPTSAS
jgi:hypothetical protein